MINNLALNQTTGDLLEAKNQISEVEGVDAIAQAIYSDLKTFLGEYWLNRSLGVPYIEVIFVKDTDLSLTNTILKEHITRREDVIELTAFQSDLDIALRKLRVIFSAKTTLGTITDQEINL